MTITTQHPLIKCTPCRLNYNGTCYRILADGSITGTLTEQQARDLGLDSVHDILDYEIKELFLYTPHTSAASTIRREAARLRRNRKRTRE